MFYSQIILAKKGPLGKIWLAAHYEKKLNKTQIYTTDIAESVQCVIEPVAPLALRVSGHLMLGIVRIYARKVKYLMADCSEAMWKMKLAFRPGAVDLPDAQMVSAGIDDARYFGNVNIDEYPMLDTSMPNLPLPFLPLPDNELYGDIWEESAPAPSTPRISDIEITRRGRDSSMTPLLTRGSLSSIVAPDINRLSLDFEHVPPFEEFGEVHLPDKPFFEPRMSTESRLPFEMELEPPVMEIEEVPPNGMTPSKELERSYEIGLPSLEAEEMARELLGEDIVSKKVALKEKPEKEKRRKPPKKKARVIVDDTVELSGRETRELIRDRSSILRRQPSEPLPRMSLLLEEEAAPVSLNLSSLSSTRDLCPELDGLFALPSIASPMRPSFGEIAYEEPEITRRGSSISSAPSTPLKLRESVSMIPSTDKRQSMGMEFELEPPVMEMEMEMAAPEMSRLSLLPEISAIEEEAVPVLESPYRKSLLETHPSLDPEKWNPRTFSVYSSVSRQLEDKDQISFQQWSQGATRHQAATRFLELLQLKTWDVLNLEQDHPFEDLYISSSVRA